MRFLLWKKENVLKRLAFVLLVSLAGTAVLLSLGKWQLDRLNWKQDILDAMTSRISAVPVSVPPNPV